MTPPGLTPTWPTRANRHRGPDMREGSPHGPLVRPGPRKVRHRVQELAVRAQRKLPRGRTNRDAGSLAGKARTPSLGLLQDATSALDTFHIVKLARDALDEARRHVQQDSTGHRRHTGAPSIESAIFYAPRAINSPHANKNASTQTAWQMRRISASKSPTAAQQVRDVFHQDTPTQGRRLAARLIKSLPTFPIPKTACMGRTLRKWKDAFIANFDTGGASTAPHRRLQRNHRTRQTHLQMLPQPHQLQTPNALHRRRTRCFPRHPTMKSHIWQLCEHISKPSLHGPNTFRIADYARFHTASLQH